MTTELLTRFIERRPFIPFEFITVDGRHIAMPHSDFGTLERYAAAVVVYDEANRAEIIDASLIVSIKTVQPLPDEPPTGDEPQR